MLKSLPNGLTVLRIILIPVIVVSFYFHGTIAKYVTAYIFIFASITDYLDGIIARKYKAETNMGRMLDPIADKMLVASTLVMMVDRGLMHVIPALAILCREFFVSGMREYLAIIKVRLPVFLMTKIKTALQMASISLVLLGEEGSTIRYANLIGNIGIWISAILTIISGIIYLRKTIASIENTKNDIVLKD